MAYGLGNIGTHSGYKANMAMHLPWEIGKQMLRTGGEIGGRIAGDLNKVGEFTGLGQSSTLGAAARLGQGLEAGDQAAIDQGGGGWVAQGAADTGLGMSTKAAEYFLTRWITGAAKAAMVAKKLPVNSATLWDYVKNHKTLTGLLTVAGVGVGVKRHFQGEAARTLVEQGETKKAEALNREMDKETLAGTRAHEVNMAQAKAGGGQGQGLGAGAMDPETQNRIQMSQQLMQQAAAREQPQGQDQGWGYMPTEYGLTPRTASDAIRRAPLSSTRQAQDRQRQFDSDMAERYYSRTNDLRQQAAGLESAAAPQGLVNRMHRMEVTAAQQPYKRDIARMQAEAKIRMGQDRNRMTLLKAGLDPNVDQLAAQQAYELQQQGYRR